MAYFYWSKNGVPYIETSIVVKDSLFKSIKVISAGFKRDENNVMRAYVELDKEDENIAIELLEYLVEKRNFKVILGNNLEEEIVFRN